MRTSWPTLPTPAIEGMLIGEPAELRPAALPYLPHVETFTLVDPEAGDARLSVIDTETGELFEVPIALPDADPANALRAIVTAGRGDAKLHDLFALSEDGASSFTLRARHANRDYDIALTTPGAMTSTSTLDQVAGGAGIELGAFVARGPGDDEVIALSDATALSDLYGITFRTDANHWQYRHSAARVDTLVRGMHHRCLAAGRIYMLAETAVLKGDPVHVRRAGSGKLGGVRASADGANTLNASSIASFETSAAAGALVRVSVRMPA